MSNTKCCVPGCVNSSGSEDTLHKFPHPAKDKELFNTWLYSVGGPILSLENEHIFKYRRVCHLHFEEKYWCQNNRLSKIAVPTKNLPGLTTTKFTLNESSVLRPIQNTMTSEPSTSKGYPAFQPSNPVTLQHHPSPANKENIDKGILPAESKDTADILLFFDRLFDSVNGSYAKKKKHGKPLLAAATPTSPHRQLWRESKKILKEMKFINHNTHKVEYVPVLKNWVWTLDGIEALLTKLRNKYDVVTVSPRMW